MTAVCVLGLGPAGRAITHWLVRAGIDVVAVDPAPQRVWRATYAAWSDELPGWLDPAVRAQPVPVRAHALTEHRLAREYTVLDTAALQRSLDLGPARVITDRARQVARHRVYLAEHGDFTAELVIDARGTRAHRRLTQQTAYGVVLDRAVVEERLGGAWLMDWRPDHGDGPDAPPSFLYAVPLTQDRMLVEETCLVGRPPLGSATLRDRLHTRLAARGLGPLGEERVEHVRFATEPDPADHIPGVLALGARGGLMHPATGYSVATALELAPRIAAAIARGEDVQRALWPPAARATARLRRAGLRALLALDATGTRAFFEAFLALPAERQRGYLSDRDHPLGTLRAMAAMARQLPPRLIGVAVTQTARELTR